MTAMVAVSIGWVDRGRGIGLKAALRLRKLLILRIGKVAKTPELADARYTPGTR
jgi:hypothetical protein